MDLHLALHQAARAERRTAIDNLASPQPAPTASALASAPLASASAVTDKERAKLEAAEARADAEEHEAEEARRGELMDAMRTDGIRFPCSKEVKLQIGNAPPRVVGGPLEPDLGALRSAQAQEEDRAHYQLVRVEDAAAVREGGGAISFLDKAGAVKDGRVVHFGELDALAQATVPFKRANMRSPPGSQHRAEGFAHLVGLNPRTPQRRLGGTPGTTPGMQGLLTTPIHDGRKGGGKGSKRTLLGIEAPVPPRGQKTKKKRKILPRAHGAPLRDAL